MPSSPWPARLAGLLAASAVVVVPAAALATPSLTVTGTLELGGDAQPFYDTLTVTANGVLRVNPYATGSKTSTGWLILKANTITVAQGGLITADGAGYPGQDGKAGVCQLAIMPASACAGPGMNAGQPGGGGGFFGAGANGALEMMAGTCTDLGAQAPGGTSFFNTTTMKLDLGSAGGAGNLANPMLTAGGAGGGGIQLFAAVILIDGTLSANGGSANPFNGVGPGGGSGGAIEITAGSLAGTGTLSVKGGNGAHGPGVPGVLPANNGGGGSGGVVLLHLPSGVTNPLTVVATGGATGGCTTLAGSKGGSASAPIMGTCVDVDGDGYTSMQCGGTDCDDSDATIHPGAPEICNGIADNCTQPADSIPNNCTDAGEICVMIGDGGYGCVAPPSDGGGTDGGGLDYIQYGGGCDVPESLPSRGAGALVLGMTAIGLMARRRRR